MVYVFTVEFDDRTPELTPNPLDVASTIRYAMNAEYAELGYRTTTAFDEPDNAERRVRARYGAGVDQVSDDPPWGEQQSQVDWLESRFDGPAGEDMEG